MSTVYSDLPSDIHGIIEGYVSSQPLFRRWANTLWEDFYVKELSKRQRLDYYRPEGIIKAFLRSFNYQFSEDYNYLQQGDINAWFQKYEEGEWYRDFINDLSNDLHEPFAEVFFEDNTDNVDFDYSKSVVDQSFLFRLREFLKNMLHQEFPNML